MALVLLYPLFRQARSLTLPQVGGRTMIAIGKALREMTAADLMSRELTLIPRDMSLPAAAHVLAGAGISGAPVVDEMGRCAGVLSTTDFFHYVGGDHPHSTPLTSTGPERV